MLKHGHIVGRKRSREYMTWSGMIQRCHNPNHPKYGGWGARGIKVCLRWRRSFVDFLSDMGPKPIGTSIERIKNNLGYSPKNCRWATPTDQANNRRSSKKICFRGATLTVSQWARKIGIKKAILAWRLENWTVERALTQGLRMSSPELRKMAVMNHPNTRHITHLGETKSASEWAKMVGMISQTLLHRLDAGWGMEKAMSYPVGGRK